MVFFSEYKDNSIQSKKYMDKFIIIIMELLTQQASQITVALNGLLSKFYAHLREEEKQDNTKHKEVICK